MMNKLKQILTYWRYHLRQELGRNQTALRWRLRPWPHRSSESTSSVLTFDLRHRTDEKLDPKILENAKKWLIPSGFEFPSVV